MGCYTHAVGLNILFMSDIIKIKRGLDIPMQGAVPADATTPVPVVARLVAICPDDFPGFKWKAAVHEGDAVCAGTPLLFARECEELKLVSPVAGKVREIHRGERRHIMYISVEADDRKPDAIDTELQSMIEAYPKATDKADALRSLLCRSGLWGYMHQRPYDIVPDPKVAPRDIFVTAFDSAPLAPELLTPDMREAHEAGLKALATLTQGKIYLGIRFEQQLTSRVAVLNEYQGPHPAGNIGVQIAHTKPVNRGEVVWTLDSRTAIRIGHLVNEGKLDTAAEVAITGPAAPQPRMAATTVGVALSELLKGELSDDKAEIRIISGNVLTGLQESENGFLRFPYRQITLLSEGAHADEFMGWASLSPKKFSVKHSFPSFFFGKNHKYDYDARLRGGQRAMILSGEYDKVFPMDILPEFLLRAIIAKDIDKMEQLGIYEVAPEDFALPEFVDTSKQPLQQMVRDGLDYLRENA